MLVIKTPEQLHDIVKVFLTLFNSIVPHVHLEHVTVDRDIIVHWKIGNKYSIYTIKVLVNLKPHKILPFWPHKYLP